MEDIESLFDISDLILKKISEDISEEENEKLISWLNISERNQELFEQIKNAKNIEDRQQILKKFDVKNAWQKYSRETIKKQPKYIRLQLLKYAAAVLLPVLVVTVYYLKKENSAPLPGLVAKEIQIKPGSKNAVLIMDDGENINLESEDLLQLKEQDGTSITKNNGLLSYKTNDDQKSDLELKNTLFIPRGGEYNLVLADGTKVYINSMSKLEFPVRFSKNIREVTLEGEACFIVEKDIERPFVVNVGGMKIEVLGTTFNVNAYNDDSRIITTLVEGKVKVKLINEPEGEIIMAPSDQVVYNLDDNHVDLQKVDTDYYIQWTKGVYTFYNQPIGEIMKTLSRWYDFNVWYETPELKKLSFEGGLNKYESIDPIIDIIESTGKVQVSIEGKNILFKEK